MSGTSQKIVLAELEAEKPEEKIELVLSQREKGSSLQVRSLRWGQGIGWFVHKTITLDPTQVKTLARLLRRSEIDNDGSKAKGKVIVLPIWKGNGGDGLP